jgi:membrane-bound lytic murein transglycosylase D
MTIPAVSARVSTVCKGVVGVLSLAWAATVVADPAQFPRPAALEPDVQFWERIYSKVSTHGGLLHDDRHLDVVYEELNFPPGLSSKERSNLVDTVRAHYERILRHLGTGNRDDLSDDERRVLALFPPTVSNEVLTEAADHVRFQLGQSDRFREGLVRSGAWEKHVEETLRREGLPGELSALPHVESSFNPRAYSKVGAAGLWQFMRGTGKRWLRVDGTVDERLDPYKSTLAAAQFLNINYSILGTWPLALTAWNHGAGGMRRAKEELGTDDITTIVRNYQGHTFGFASRNFYVSFLAALDVDRNAERFFGRVDRMPHDDSRTVRLPALVPAQALEKTLGTDRETLRALNLSLLEPIWEGRRPVPRGYELRVPAGVDAGRLLAKLGHATHDDSAKERSVVVGRSDTLDRIATQYGLRTKELAEYNHVTSRDIHPGMTLRVPTVGSLPEPSAASVAPTPAAVAAEVATAPAATPERPQPEYHVVVHGESLSGIAHATGVSVASLLALNGLARADLVREGQKLRLQDSGTTATEAAHIDTVLPPTVESSRVAPAPSATEAADDSGVWARDRKEGVEDPADYSVAKGTIVIQAAETLGMLAKWSGVSVDRLRAMNHLKPSDPMVLGHRIKVELVGVDAAGFEARRTEYHRSIEAAYFEAHRLVGVDHHPMHAGDTLWTLTQKGQIPVWLLRQYNPDVDFSTVRVGTTVNVPQVQAVDAVTPAGKGNKP